MTKDFLHINRLFGTMLLLFGIVLCQSCSHSDRSDEPQAEDVRRMEVNLTMNVKTRGAEGEDLGEPQTLKLWFYGVVDGEESEQPLLYKEYDYVDWTKVEPAQTVENVGEVIYTARMYEEVKVKKDYNRLQIYAVVNSEAADFNPVLSDELTEQQFCSTQFTVDVANNVNLKDNELMMFGSAKIEDTSLELYEEHSVVIYAERCVSKIELYLTQQEDDSGLAPAPTSIDLKLLEVNLSKRPLIGSLLPPKDLPSSVADNNVNLFLQASPGLDITPILSSKVWSTDKLDEAFSDNPNSFQKINFVDEAPQFLYERKGLAETIGFPDDVTGTDAYTLTLRYMRYGKEESSKIALCNVKRNTIYRIFVRIRKDTKIDINIKTQQWTWGDGKKDIDITHEHEDLPVTPPLPYN